jgi:hypothetical protein
MIRLEMEKEEKVISRSVGVMDRMLSGIVQEESHPAIEAIKRDASTRPEEYVLNYVVPAEGE